MQGMMNTSIDYEADDTIEKQQMMPAMNDPYLYQLQDDINTRNYKSCHAMNACIPLETVRMTPILKTNIMAMHLYTEFKDENTKRVYHARHE